MLDFVPAVPVEQVQAPVYNNIVHERSIDQVNLKQKPISLNLESCFIEAANKYNLPVRSLLIIKKLEGGKSGSKVRNNNGTYDYGYMQINTVNLSKIKKALNYSKEELQYDLCKSVNAAAYLLSGHVAEENNIWRAIGRYHSKTSKHKVRYMIKAVNVASNLK